MAKKKAKKNKKKIEAGGDDIEAGGDAISAGKRSLDGELKQGAIKEEELRGELKELCHELYRKDVAGGRQQAITKPKESLSRTLGGKEAIIEISQKGIVSKHFDGRSRYKNSARIRIPIRMREDKVLMPLGKMKQ